MAGHRRAACRAVRRRHLIEVAVIRALILRHVDSTRRLDSKLHGKFRSLPKLLIRHRLLQLCEKHAATRRARLERRRLAVLTGI